jgi:hypothetical protein
MSDDATRTSKQELYEIADTVERNGGWDIAALKIRAAADEIDRLTAQVESLQNRWASRPLSHPDGEALCAENARLREERGRWYVDAMNCRVALDRLDLGHESPYWNTARAPDETSPQPIPITSERLEYHANGTYWNGVPTVDWPCDFCNQSIVDHDPRTHACQPVETPVSIKSEQTAAECNPEATSLETSEPRIGSVVTMLRYKERGEHEGWIVTWIRETPQGKFYDVRHPQGGATSATRDEIEVAGLKASDER